MGTPDRTTDSATDTGRETRARIGRVMIPVGAVGLVAGLALTALTVVTLLDQARSLTDGPVATSGAPLSIELESGESRTLWAREGTPGGATCGLRNEDGRPPTRGRSGNVTVSLNGEEFRRAAEFTAVDAGTHVLTCTGTHTVTGSGTAGAGIVLRVLGALLLLVASIVAVVAGTVWRLGGTTHVVARGSLRSRPPRAPRTPRPPRPEDGPVSTAWEPPGL